MLIYWTFCFKPAAQIEFVLDVLVMLKQQVTENLEEQVAVKVVLFD